MSSMHFRNSLPNNTWHCVVHSHWCLFPLPMFSCDHAQSFVQYLWNFGLEAQSHSLKESCLPPVRPAVNHYLAQVALPICVWFTIHIGLVKYTTASLTASQRPWQSCTQNFSDAKPNTAELDTQGLHSTMWRLPKVCLKTGNNFWIPPTAQHHKDSEV